MNERGIFMYEFDIEMPADYKQMLLDMVDLSKKTNCLTISSHDHYDGKHDNYLISVYDDKFELFAKGDPIITFQSLGFLQIIHDKEWASMGLRSFVILPKAFEWSDYQKKNGFRKGLQKLPSTIRDIGLFISFVLSIASFVWIIIQVMNNFN
jgi:hypothetical protein